MISPECRSGKHANCWDEAYDPDADELVPCQCECHGRTTTVTGD